jgi:hypothetical protein
MKAGAGAKQAPTVVALVPEKGDVEAVVLSVDEPSERLVGHSGLVHQGSLVVRLESRGRQAGPCPRRGQAAPTTTAGNQIISSA